MRKLHQRVMAMALACLMVVGLAPVSAMATDGASADAETYYVADSASGGSNVEGTGSYDHPYMTISHVIEVAVEDGEDELIISLLSGVEISNELDLSGDSGLSALTINGNGHNITFAQNRDVGNLSGMVSVTDGLSLALSDIGLARLQGNQNSAGLLYVQDASVTLDDVTLASGRKNVADIRYGGSAVHVANGGAVTITGGTTISQNVVVGGASSSGAVFVAEGGSLYMDSGIIEDNRFEGDAATHHGLGVYAQSGSTVKFYSEGEPITVTDEVFVEVGANVSVGAVEGESEHIQLSQVYLDSDVTAAREIATLDICGDTSDAVIGVEMLENYHYAYRLISAEADGYSIQTATGNMDETGWTDLCGAWDIRYMNYRGVPGLYLWYHSINTEFYDVDTLTGITGEDINGESVSYYNPEDVQNSVISDGTLYIPELVAIAEPGVDGGYADFTFTFTVDEANKDYRIPTADMVSVIYIYPGDNGSETTVLTKDDNYSYTPNFEDGSAVLTVFGDTLAGLKAGGTLRFEISGEKYSLLTLDMNGPVYTMSTDVTGQSVTQAMSVNEQVTDNGGSQTITYTVTRDDNGDRIEDPQAGVEVVLYREGTSPTDSAVIQTATTGADGKVTFDGLDPNFSYYYVLYYTESFHVIARDIMTLMLSTLEGQKLADRCDYNASAADVTYDIRDAENFYTASSTITNVTTDTTVSYYVDMAQDRINFIANQQDSSTADTATFIYTGESYRQDEFSKTMETNASTYGNLPNMTMEGYTFMGWYTQPDWTDETGRVTSLTPYDTNTSAKTLYAHWAPHYVGYQIQHWVELAPEGVNPGYVSGTTELKEANGTMYYLWSYDNYADENADEILDNLNHLVLPNMDGTNYSWWTLDGFDVTTDTECHVLADGTSVFGIYYDRKDYVITYNPMEGQMTSDQNTQSVRFGDIVGPMLEATRPGYDFGGWYTELGVNNEASVTATSWYTWTNGITVYPHWITSDVTYTIIVMTEDMSRYDDGMGLGYADGTYTQFKIVTTGNDGKPLPGMADTPQTVVVDSLDALRITGFTYIGWNTMGDENATGLHGNDSVFEVTPNEESNTRIYLYYSRNEVDVTFRDDDTPDAGVHDEVTIVFGDTFEHALPDTNPTKPGYDFTGWADMHGNPIGPDTSTNEYTAAGDGAMDVYPVWNARTYYLTYVPGQGSTFDVSSLGVGYTEDSDVSGGYTVHQPIVYDMPLGTLPTAEKYGYEFLGWQLKDGPAAGQFVNPGTMASVHNVIVRNDANSFEETYPLYAVYEAYHFTLELDPEKGTLPGLNQGESTTVPVAYDSPIPELPTPVLEGHTFVGWVLDMGAAGETYIEAGDIWTYITTNTYTVKAHAVYVPNDYTYHIDLNDCNSNPPFGSTVAHLYDMTETSVDITFGENFYDALDGLVAQRNGYIFLGWSTSRDLADLITADTVNDVASAGTIYAMWQPKVYELRIDLNGGIGLDTDGNILDGSYSWNQYAARYYEDYETTYGVANLAATVLDDGTISVPVIFDTTYGQLDTLVKDNYRFDGYLATAPHWYHGDEQVIHGQVVTALDMNFDDLFDDYVLLEALWTPYFDFNLNAADATFSVPADVSGQVLHIVRDDLKELGQLPEATRPGYAFYGWKDTATGDIVTYDEVIGMDEYHSFEAVWTPEVTFIGNGGKVMVDGVAYDEYTIGLRQLVEQYGNFLPVRHETMTFMGWIADDHTDMSSFANLANRTTPVTLTASWDVTITFRLTEGAVWAGGHSEVTAGEHNDLTVPASDVGAWANLPEARLDNFSFLYWIDENSNPVTNVELGQATKSMVVYSAFRADGGAEDSRINVTVRDYTQDASNYTEPVDGWVAGENAFIVNAEQACAVALVRDGVMTELSCSSIAANGAHVFTVNAQDGDEIILVYRGDADLDAGIDFADATTINQYLLGLYEFDDVKMLAADADLDDGIDFADATTVNQYLLGLYTIRWRTAE